MNEKKVSLESKKPIGIFDSGVGGLTVVKEVINKLPNENIIYFGDTARVPYGSKSKQTVTKLSKQIMNFLISKDVKAVIIACNTVSSTSYDELAASFDVPIIEVVRPGVNLCLSVPNIKKIGVIGTHRTVSSGSYEKYIKAARPDIEVYSQACPLFVPLAEEGWTDNSVTQMTAKIYLDTLIKNDIDALILGCTHYPLLKDCIQKTIGNRLIINPAIATATDMEIFLKNNDLLNISKDKPNHIFYVSDNTEKFDFISRLALGKPYSAKIIDIEKY